MGSDRTTRGLDTPGLSWRLPDAVRGKAAVVVWVVWALLGLGALAISWRYAYAPIWGDDWIALEVLGGLRPATLGWLWEPYNSHRYVIPRVIFLALYTVTGYNPLLALFNPLALAALAAGFLLLARRLRGRTSYADVFFPLVLLHGGHSDNLYATHQLVIVLATCLTGTLLILLSTSHRGSRAAVLLIVACAVCHPLCGAFGLAYAPSLVLWLGYAGISHLAERRTGTMFQGALLLLAATGAGVVTCFYFLGLEKLPEYQSPDWQTTFRAAIQLLSMGFGPFAPRLTVHYGTSGILPLWWVLGIGVLLLTLLSAARLAHVWIAHPEERVRASGFLAVLAGAGCLVLGTADGRGGADLIHPPPYHYMTSQARYCLTVVPLLCATFLAGVLYARDPWARAVSTILVVSAVVLLPLNTLLAPDNWPASQLPAQAVDRARQFERDLQAGVPVSVLCANYDGVNSDLLAGLRHQQVGRFRALQDDPGYQEIPLSVASVDEPTVRLPRARFVYGVRLECTGAEPSVLRVVRVFWQGPGKEDWIAARENEIIQIGAAVPLRVIWVADTIRGLRLDMGELTPHLKLTLLVPAPPE